ncbi:22884_t:CDS:2, partial [Cetraspora pellucida]
SEEKNKTKTIKPLLKSIRNYTTRAKFLVLKKRKYPCTNMLHFLFVKSFEIPMFYKKIRTSNIYEEETSLNSGSSKSLLEQTKAQVLNSQELKALSTQKAQEAYIITDLKVSKK